MEQQGGKGRVYQVSLVVRARGQASMSEMGDAVHDSLILLTLWLRVVKTPTTGREIISNKRYA